MEIVPIGEVAGYAEDEGCYAPACSNVATRVVLLGEDEGCYAICPTDHEGLV